MHLNRSLLGYPSIRGGNLAWVLCWKGAGAQPGVQMVVVKSISDVCAYTHLCTLSSQRRSSPVLRVPCSEEAGGSQISSPPAAPAQSRGLQSCVQIRPLKRSFPGLLVAVTESFDTTALRKQPCFFFPLLKSDCH